MARVCWGAEQAPSTEALGKGDSGSGGAGQERRTQGETKE